MIDLLMLARSFIGDNVQGRKLSEDFAVLCEAIYAAPHAVAEVATTYNYEAEKIINEYTSQVSAEEVDDALSGRTYTADEWRDAMNEYAYAVAKAYINAAMEKESLSLRDISINFAAVASVYSGRTVPLADVTVTAGVPYGWASHDTERGDVLAWLNGQLDGLNAVARPFVGGTWLSFAWEAA